MIIHYFIKPFTSHSHIGLPGCSIFSQDKPTFFLQSEFHLIIQGKRRSLTSRNKENKKNSEVGCLLHFFPVFCANHFKTQYFPHTEAGSGTTAYFAPTRTPNRQLGSLLFTVNYIIVLSYQELYILSILSKSVMHLHQVQEY